MLGKDLVRIATRAGTAACALAISGAAIAQTGTGGTITSGTAVFTMGASPTSNTGTGVTSSDLRIAGATGTDSLFATWWWIRINGVDTRELCLANASSGVWSGNVGTLTYATASYNATATYTLTQPAANAARVIANLRIHNNTASPLDLAIFNYSDFDYAGTAGTDSATLDSTNSIKITETTSTTAPFASLLAYYQGPGANAWQVTAFATLRGLLADTSINNLTNAGLPFGPADFTGAFQYNRVVPANGDVVVTAVLGIDTVVPPLPSTCQADYNGNGTLEVQDIFDFLNGWLAGNPAADFNGGGLDVQDIFDFLNAWLAGCP